jgi:hypothetical protein
MSGQKKKPAIEITPPGCEALLVIDLAVMQPIRTVSLDEQPSIHPMIEFSKDGNTLILSDGINHRIDFLNFVELLRESKG